MFSFAQGQEEPFPGVNFFGVKFVSYHSLLCDVKGVDVSEPGFRELINAILSTWAPDIPAYCSSAAVFTSSTATDERYSGHVAVTVKVDPLKSTPSNIQTQEGIQALEDLWQDICKQQRHRGIEEGNPIPLMAKHPTFSIPSVNATKQTICGAIEGFDGRWTSPIDFLGKRLILQESIRVGLQTTYCPILTELNEEKELLMV